MINSARSRIPEAFRRHLITLWIAIIVLCHWLSISLSLAVEFSKTSPNPTSTFEKSRTIVRKDKTIENDQGKLIQEGDI